MKIPELYNILNTFVPLGLEEMNVIRLMNRVDTKFIFSVAKLPLLISQLTGTYKILEIEGQRDFSYFTRYFDTPELLFYNQHVTGRLARHKVRYRKYELTGDAFLEIKMKSNRNRTTKWRIVDNSDSGIMNEESFVFLKKHINYNIPRLEPVLQNSFTRTTLANLETGEKITMDFNICFTSVSGASVELPFLAIAEQKSAGYSCNSPFRKIIRKTGFLQSGFSKYCIGNALVQDFPKKNALKPKLLLIKKIENEYFESDCT